MAAQPSHLESRIGLVLTDAKPRAKWRALAQLPTPPGAGSVDHATGSLEPAQIQAAVHEHLPEVLACCQALRAKTPEAQGSFAMEWTLDADGKMGDRCVGQGFAVTNGGGHCDRRTRSEGQLRARTDEQVGCLEVQKAARWT